MSFYKRIDEELLIAPNFVHTPDISLLAEEHGNHTYPVEGWYWFDTLNDAMLNMMTSAQSISPVQAKIVLHRHGLLVAVETAIANAPIETQLAWTDATSFSRNSTVLNDMATALGLSPAQLDAMFTEAAAIVI